MPRGKPKRPTVIRVDPAMMAEVRRYTDNFTGAVEAGLTLWLKKARRKATLEAKRSRVAEDAST